MSQSPTEILLHPVRLRIVLAFGSEELTTGQLAERLPDIAPATLYRQVATLVDAGMLEVVHERRVRGGVERTYALVAGAITLGPDDAEEASREQLLRGFTVFAGLMVDAVGRYLEDPDADPSRDPLGFRQAAIWLDDDEREELLERMRDAIAPYLGNEPSAERERLRKHLAIATSPTRPQTPSSGPWPTDSTPARRWPSSAGGGWITSPCIVFA